MWHISYGTKETIKSILTFLIAFTLIFLFFRWSCSDSAPQEHAKSKYEIQQDSIEIRKKNIDSLSLKLCEQHNITIQSPNYYSTTIKFQDSLAASNKLALIKGYTLKDIFRINSEVYVHLRQNNMFPSLDLMIEPVNYVLKIREDELKVLNDRLSGKKDLFLSQGWNSNYIQFIFIVEIEKLDLLPQLANTENSKEFFYSWLITGNVSDLVDVKGI